MLVGLFASAVNNDLIAKSPAADLRLPKTAEPGERRALTQDERRLFLAAAGELGLQGLFFVVNS